MRFGLAIIEIIYIRVNPKQEFGVYVVKNIVFWPGRVKFENRFFDEDILNKKTRYKTGFSFIQISAVRGTNRLIEGLIDQRS